MNTPAQLLTTNFAGYFPPGTLPPNPVPLTPQQRELHAARYLQTHIREQARARYEAAVPPMMRADATDWTTPKLAANADAIATVRTWQYRTQGLLLTGPTGRGKTRSLMALMQRLACDEARDIRIYHASEWYGHLNDQINYGKDEAEAWVRAIAKNRPIIVIDDLGQEAILGNRSEWAMSWFFRFLDLRLQAQLPLFVTTNLTSTQIAGTDKNAQIRTDPLLRRLLELCEIVKFN